VERSERQPDDQPDVDLVGLPDSGVASDGQPPPAGDLYRDARRAAAIIQKRGEPRGERGRPGRREHQNASAAQRRRPLLLASTRLVAPGLVASALIAGAAVAAAGAMPSWIPVVGAERPSGPANVQASNAGRSPPRTDNTHPGAEAVAYLMSSQALLMRAEHGRAAQCRAHRLARGRHRPAPLGTPYHSSSTPAVITGPPAASYTPSEASAPSARSYAQSDTTTASSTAYPQTTKTTPPATATSPPAATQATSSGSTSSSSQSTRAFGQGGVLGPGHSPTS
jgi:hypothetical protein